MKKPAAKRVGSRVEHSYFDFNDPLHERAARAVKPDQLATLFEQLDRADEQFGRNARKGTLAALDAAMEFLAKSPLNGNGRFSRPFELLLVELRKRPAPADPTRILPPAGGGAGGVVGRQSDAYIKAYAACAVEWLHTRAGQPVKTAAAEIAGAMAKQGFKFGGRRAEKAAAIVAWRRDYLKKSQPGVLIADICAALCKRPPMVLTDTKAANRTAIFAWFNSLLARAGYGETA